MAGYRLHWPSREGAVGDIRGVIGARGVIWQQRDGRRKGREVLGRLQCNTLGMAKKQA